MRYFYDTEFLDNGRTIDLISIGIVREDDETYYAVNSEIDQGAIKEHHWLKDNVWPHLPLRGDKVGLKYVGGVRGDAAGHTVGLTDYGVLDTGSALVKPRWVIANEVRDFLTVDPERENNELWAYYCAYDHVALAQLWEPMIRLPKGVPMWTHDLKQEMERLGVATYAVPANESEHNALVDAQWNKCMYEELQRRT